MSRIVSVLCILALTIGFIGFHTYQILNLNKDVTALSSSIEESYQRDDWDEVREKLDQLQKRWDESRFWASLTIDTEKIEDIEISLRQSTEYAAIQAKPDFIGEFIMFQMLAEHLPHQEGFSPEELL